ncbi:hypothetical protein JZU46_00335, partial [bacterium]|nr:hypothetical protein [bacterium]
MNDLTTHVFDYALVDTDTADRLKEIGKEIRAIDALACIQIGGKLAEAQKAFNRRGKSGAEGGFLDWVEAETPYSRSAAYQLLSAHQRFSKNDFQISGNHFKRSVLFALSAPSTPDSVIEKALTIAETGKTLTVAQVEQMKRDARADAEARVQELRGLMDKANQEIAEKGRTGEQWRQQAIDTKKQLTVKDQTIEAGKEVEATLRKNIAKEAARLADAKLGARVSRLVQGARLVGACAWRGSSGTGAPGGGGGRQHRDRGAAAAQQRGPVHAGRGPRLLAGASGREDAALDGSLGR